jgi:hypothetical protein
MPLLQYCDPIQFAPASVYLCVGLLTCEAVILLVSMLLGVLGTELLL